MSNDYDRDILADALKHAGPQLFGTFVIGYREGIIRNAVWNEGEQFVGVLRQPLAEVLEAIEAIAADLVPTDPDGSETVRRELAE